MLRTVLCDLDETLLDIDIRAMVREYFGLLSEHLAPFLPGQDVVAHVLASTRLMSANEDPTRDNLSVFWEDFCARTGADPEAAREAFDRFYTDHFGNLRHYARPMPGARPLMEWLFAQGYEVAIATQPIFPLAAIRHRLQWAGLDDFPYPLITVCETMHACKPSPLYYREVLAQLGRRPEECLMVGNDQEKDMPARAVGIRTYLVSQTPPQVPVDHWGSLAGVRAVLEADRRGEHRLTSPLG